MWSEDVGVMNALDEFLINQKDDLRKLLIEIYKHNDGSPPFQMFQVYGKFVMIYSELRQIHVETDAYELTVAQIANDPTVQNLISKMLGASLDKGLNL